jgi:hypothetical protein
MIGVMRGPLDGVALKLARAKEHVDSLADVFRPFRSANFQVSTEGDPETRMRAVKVHFPKPDPKTSTVIGDCLHNLRSALDHTVYQLVQANGGEPTPDHMFPIAISAQAFEKSARKRLRGISPAARAAIEAMQPYHFGPAANADPLAVLAALSNIDKHRTLALTTVIARDVDVDLGGVRVLVVGSGMVDGAELFRDDRLADAMNATARGSMFIVFDGGPAAGRDVLMVLSEMLECVTTRVMPAIEPWAG